MAVKNDRQHIIFHPDSPYVGIRACRDNLRRVNGQAQRNSPDSGYCSDNNYLEDDMSTQMRCPYCNGVALVSSTGRMWCAGCKTGSGK